jgi:Possible lysine decarboxylase
VKETSAFVLFPGGFGTLDEGFEVLTLLQTGKTSIVPIILMDRPNGFYWETWRRFLDNDLLELGLISRPDFHLFTITHDVDRAVEEIKHFYKVFHSYRWVRDEMVIRINGRLTPHALETLNQQFDHLLISGHIVQREALPEEADDVSVKDLPRLVLTPYKREFGMLRLLINAINDSAVLEDRTDHGD